MKIVGNFLKKKKAKHPTQAQKQKMMKQTNGHEGNGSGRFAENFAKKQHVSHTHPHREKTVNNQKSK